MWPFGHWKKGPKDKPKWTIPPAHSSTDQPPLSKTSVEIAIPALRAGIAISTYVSRTASRRYNPRMPPAAVLFDMDGLMFDTETLAFRAWSRALAEHGLEMREADYSRLIGRNMVDARIILLDAYGPDTPVDALDAARFRYSTAEVEERGVPLKPGLVALLDALDALGIPRAMATSTGRERATQLLERAGLSGRFHAIVCGDDITRGKPAPDIFLAAAMRLDAPPKSCLVLEDSEPGVRAAHAARMTAILIPDLAPVAPDARELAWRIVTDLGDVIPLLSQCQEFRS